MSLARILIVDDEAPIRKFLKVALEAHGFEVVEAATGRDGLGKAATATPQIVVLDLGLPDTDGKSVVAGIREWSDVPILVLSVRDSETEKIAALDAGANDYVVKPFSIGELLARLRVLLRTSPSAGAADPELRRGPLKIDLARHRVELDGEELRLTPKEFALLATLVRHSGRLVTHRQLLREVWGVAHEEDPHYLRVFVGRLRQKLGDDPAAPRFILNEPGVGYRFIDDSG